MAREHGLTPKVVRSAREALGIKIQRDGFGPGGKSMWSLPDPEEYIIRQYPIARGDFYRWFQSDNVVALVRIRRWRAKQQRDE
jgi:hypothetical protein